MLKFASQEFCSALLRIMNEDWRTGTVPDNWKLVPFTMLPKLSRAIATKDFRPIACLRLFYKIYTLLILGRVETKLEAEQPRQQAAYRKHRNLEEHVFSVNQMIEKNKPATFKYPFFSLASDFIMFWHILTFQITKKLEEANKIKN
jgi:inhibitor of KinA sporulation pathway (predicted exonuclease)